mgnify:FL=1
MISSRSEGLPLDRHDALCLDAGLELHERFATWDMAPWSPANDYAVSVHRRKH